MKLDVKVVPKFAGTPKEELSKVPRRLPADKRREAMLDAAAVHFAEYGFESTTRDIAQALGVTQALIYKHFASKEDLIERTLERMFTRDARDGPWLDSTKSLQDELLRFYLTFVSESSDLRMRLFLRAGLDGRSWPTRRGHALNRGLFLPAITALRTKAGIAATDDVPPLRGERELFMSLHASMVFLGIRRHIYGMQMPKTLDDIVTLYVTNFMAGAVQTIRDLHADGDERLKLPFAASPDEHRVTSPDPPETSST